MARAQAQYFRIFDADGITYQRWQSFYGNTTIRWEGRDWIYVSFEADGVTEGVTGDEASINLTAPSTTIVSDAFLTAIREGYLAEVRMYQFNALGDLTAPQADQQLVSSFVGQVVGGSATATKMTIQIGSALSPVGLQVPPRRLTVGMIGVGCKL